MGIRRKQISSIIFLWVSPKDARQQWKSERRRKGPGGRSEKSLISRDRQRKDKERGRRKRCRFEKLPPAC